MKLDDAIEDFLLAGRQGGWRKSTVDTYRWHLKHFHRWLEAQGVDDVEAVDVKTLRRWGAGIHDGWQIGTTRGAVAAARSFFRWLAKEGVMPADLSSTLRMPRVPEREQRTISHEEIEKLFKACAAPLHEEEADGLALALAVRNVALVAVLFDSLIRAAELCNLHLSDVDLDKGLLRIRSGKGGKNRSAPIGPDAVLALKVWLPLRASPAVRLASGVDNLFVSLGGNTPGRPLTVSGLRVIVRRLGERAGLDRMSPHAFRRGGAVAKMINGMPVRKLQDEAGWSSVTMADVYTRLHPVAR